MAAHTCVMGPPCNQPATVEYAGGVLCDMHFDQAYAMMMVDEAKEAVAYLGEWLTTARDADNDWLERVLLDALDAATLRAEKGQRLYEEARGT